MKAIIVASLVFLTGCQSAIMNAKPTGDCRPMAEIARKPEGSIEITFYRNLVEIVDGQVHCDFGYTPVRVENPTVKGKALEVTERAGIPVYMISDASIDEAASLAVNFDLDGVGYNPDSESVEPTPDGSRIRFRKFPPK